MKETNIETRVEVAIEQIRQLRDDVTEIKEKLDRKYVTRMEVDDIKTKIIGNKEDIKTLKENINSITIKVGTVIAILTFLANAAAGHFF